MEKNKERDLFVKMIMLYYLEFSKLVNVMYIQKFEMIKELLQISVEKIVI